MCNQGVLVNLAPGNVKIGHAGPCHDKKVITAWR
jgi:hypothetical protein